MIKLLNLYDMSNKKWRESHGNRKIGTTDLDSWGVYVVSFIRFRHNVEFV